jgi:oligopeptide/dipeptide ABC transporter ATP-binding protein
MENFSLTLNRGRLSLIDSINLSINKGEILGVVGESGCGKSMTALSVMNLHPRKLFSTEGAIYFGGEDIRPFTEEQMLKIRGNRIAMIFQEPMTSLNPVYTVGWQIVEMIRLHRQMSRQEAESEAVDRLRLVAISSPEEMLRRYPHELSGGMRQRVMIAMAMANEPELLIADEPTTALDVTIQAQILDLMLKLREETSAGIMLITHNLGMVAEMCDRVTVMYAGRIVEEAGVRELFRAPMHPYTVGLLASLPKLDDERTRLDTIPGSVPSPQYFDRTACRFAPRCRYAGEKCRTVKPEPVDAGGGHRVFCHRAPGTGGLS